MSETFTYRGSLSWGIPAGQLRSLLPEGLDMPLGEVGEVGREVGVGLELPARGLPLPSEMNAPAAGGCPRKQLPINNGSSTCQEVVGREVAATEME